MPKKHFNDISCGCKNRSFERVNTEQHWKLFNNFWKLGNFDLQNAYISGCVKVVNTRKPTVKLTSSLRLFSRVYYVSTNSCSVSICKIAFLHIHSISNGRLARAMKTAQSEGDTPHCDQRGRHTPVNKTSDAVISCIKEHIESFPK